MTVNELDPSQKFALTSIIDDQQDRNLFLIYGPPGTGKSQLLVSLLFELATTGKKVLFVSQNTEALAVIERMIAKNEKEMRIPEDGLSLSDFCLRLYTKEHRYLKYIRAQSSRVKAKIIPSVDTYEGDMPAEVSYALDYTNLDRALNYSVRNEEIGMDELLKSLLRYVNADLVVETLDHFNEVRLREALSLLDSYKAHDDFSYYSQPQNELRFITTTSPAVNLTDIQSGVREIGAQVDSLPSTPPAKTSLTITAYLSLLKGYIKLQSSLNLYRIQADHPPLDQVELDFKVALDESKKLIPSDSLITGLELARKPLFIDVSQIQYLEVDSIGKYGEHLQELAKIVDSFRRVDIDLMELEAKDILFSLIKKVNVDISPITSKVPEIRNCNAIALSKVLEDTLAYSKKGKLEKLNPLKTLPESYKEYLPNAKKNDLDVILAYYSQLETVAVVLKSTNVRVKTYEQLSEKSAQYKQAVNLFSNLEEGKYIALTSKILRAIELTRMYGLEKLRTLNKLQTGVESLATDLETYNTIVLANKAKAIHLTSKELVRSMNATIANNLARKKINELFESNGRYLINASSADSFVGLVEGGLRCIQAHKQAIINVCNNLVLPAEFILSEHEAKVDQLNDLMTATRNKHLYSERFFTLTAGQDLLQWYEAVRNVQHLHNVDELDAYIRHHKFISDLRAALAGNDAWLDTILEENTNFYDFASRLANSLIKTSFQNLPSNNRKLATADYFKVYAERLKSERKQYYINGLRKLLQQTSQAARNVSNPNNWRDGASTMEKIRNSTPLLSEVFPIMIATPKDVAKYISPTEELFDYVVFDEASQLLPGQALPSIFRSKKAVIIGDPHQMPPTLISAIGGISSDEDSDDIDAADSILDLAKNMQPDTQYHLKVHYRSESNKLFEPSREVIYAQDGIQPIYEAKMYDAAPIDIADNLGVGLDQTGQYDQNFSTIVRRIGDYLETDPSASFCILFLRAEDLHAFKEYLATYETTLGDIYKLYSENKILISTITNCQGIEGTYTVLYFRHYDSPGAMWFFRETAGAYKRLNVAITRQVRGLSLLMADPKEKWLEACETKLANPEMSPNTRKSAELLRTLLNNAGEITDTEYLDKRLGENSLRFESPLIEEVYKKLVQHYKPQLDNEMKVYCNVGWQMLIPDPNNIDENKRNVGFKVDLGIYSMRQKKFTLGIEMDGSVYHSDFDKEHSDYQRLKVLKVKGWEMHRIWSTNWLNNQSAEFERLTKKIDGNLFS